MYYEAPIKAATFFDDWTGQCIIQRFYEVFNDEVIAKNPKKNCTPHIGESGRKIPMKHQCDIHLRNVASGLMTCIPSVFHQTKTGY